jgi:hypothetical protein
MEPHVVGRNTMRRHAGLALIVVGIIHVALFSVLYRDRYAAIARDGLVGAVDGDAEREAAFWTMGFGVLLLTVGSLLHRVETYRGEGSPAFTGWMLLGLGLVGGILMPASPFWLFVPLGLAVLRRPRSVEAAAPATPPADVRDAGRAAA